MLLSVSVRKKKKADLWPEGGLTEKDIADGEKGKKI